MNEVANYNITSFFPIGSDVRYEIGSVFTRQSFVFGNKCLSWGAQVRIFFIDMCAKEQKPMGDRIGRPSSGEENVSIVENYFLYKLMYLNSDFILIEKMW